MSNQIFKNGVMRFLVDAYDQSVYDSKIVFSTQDIGTAKLIFQLRKDGVPLPLSAVDGKLVLLFNNGSKNIRNITLVDKLEGIAEYSLDDDEIKLYGKVQASLNLYYRNGQSLSIHEFTFDIQRNLIDEDIVPLAEYYIEDFQTLKEQIHLLSENMKADLNNLILEMDVKTEDLRVELEQLNEKLKDLNEIETVTGAQDKVNLSLKSSRQYTDDHANNQDVHVTQQDKDSWNNGQLYKLTQDSGDRLPLPKELNGTDVLSLPSGRYYAAGQYLTNMPTVNDSGWFNIDVMSAVTRKDIHICRSFDNVHWFGTVHTDGSFKSWERMVTSSDLDSAWTRPTLQHGWKQYVPADGADHTFRISKVAGVVEIKGAVSSGLIGLETPVFTLPAGYRPMQSEYFIGVASSVGTPDYPQYHRTFIGTDGRVCIESSSNPSNPNRFLSFGFRFRTK
ncbi:BppU family phage baseplate upper protein [Bacillus altitudinis]|uniref:BppU family phage baseplate upper protein n=1 Tax=Bacillus altitudinis TaxID=293387 RepID=UPI003CF1627B